MAIQKGDLIVANDVLIKTIECYENIKDELSNKDNWVGGNNPTVNVKWNTFFDSKNSDLRSAYNKKKNIVKINNKNVVAEIESLHPSFNDITSYFDPAHKSYNVVKGQSIAVAELVSCMLSCFTVTTSLRMALYAMPAKNGFSYAKTMTVFKSGSNFPTYKNWDNKYTALLSSNLTAICRTAGDYKNYIFANRATTNTNATTFEGGDKITDIVGWAAKGQLRFDSVVGGNGYYKILSGKHDGGFDGSLGTYVPSITNWDGPNNNVSLKRKNVIFASGVNNLYNCLSTINKTLASAYYGVYAGIDGYPVSIIYHISSEYIIGNKNVSTLYVSFKGVDHVVSAWNVALKPTPTLNNAPFDHWDVYENDTLQNPDKIPSGNPITSVYSNGLGKTKIKLNKKYVDIWYCIPGIWESNLLSWGTWIKGSEKVGFLRPEDTVYYSLSANNKLGFPTKDEAEKVPGWCYYHDRKTDWFDKFGRSDVVYGDDNSEFAKGMMSDTGYSPGVVIKKSSSKIGVSFYQKSENGEVELGDKTAGYLSGVVDYGKDSRNSKVRVSRWASMVSEWYDNPAIISAGMIELSSTFNQLTKTHWSNAVFLVDHTRFPKELKWANLKTHIPKKGTTLKPDGVYLINRYICPPSLDINEIDEKAIGDGVKPYFWGGVKKVNFPGRLNTFLRVGKSSSATELKDANFPAEWHGKPILDAWGKPMWFSLEENGSKTKKRLKIDVYVVRIRKNTTDDAGGTDMSWGEGAKFSFIRLESEAKLTTGKYLDWSTNEYVRISNFKNNWIKPTANAYHVDAGAHL